MNPYAIPTTIQLTKTIERPQPTKILTKLRITIDNIELNNSASIRSQLLTENEDYVEEKKLHLTGTDYTNWKEDGYIVDWVKQQLNITDAETVTPDIVIDVSWVPVINMDGSLIISIPNTTVDVSNNTTDLSYSLTDLSYSFAISGSNVELDASGFPVNEASANLLYLEMKRAEDLSGLPTGASSVTPDLSNSVFDFSEVVVDASENTQ
jgi:hypothetical protein